MLMPMWLRLLAEMLGTTVLVAAVVGSGVMAEGLTDDRGLALLLNLLASVCALGVLIATLLPISGAHLNPAVTLAMVASRRTSITEGAGYIGAQAIGGVLGTLLAHAMFSRTLVEVSSSNRLSSGTFIGELVATVGLIAIILTLIYQRQVRLMPLLVPAWIAAGYVFTSSTSFANPAVTLGRVFTESFTGIDPVSAVWFVFAQLLGAALALALVLPFRIAYAKEQPHE